MKSETEESGGGKTKPVLIMMRPEFLEEIDRAYPLAGFNDRASFVRDAVYQALLKLGISVPLVLKTAPDRKGKGGTPSHKNYRSLKT